MKEIYNKEDLEEKLKDNPKDPNLNLVYGSLLGHSGKIEEAKKHFEISIQNSENDADIQARVGMNFWAFKQYSEAFDKLYDVRGKTISPQIIGELKALYKDAQKDNVDNLMSQMSGDNKEVFYTQAMLMLVSKLVEIDKMTQGTWINPGIMGFIMDEEWGQRFKKLEEMDLTTRIKPGESKIDSDYIELSSNPTTLERRDFNLDKITELAKWYDFQKVMIRGSDRIYHNFSGLYTQIFPFPDLAMRGILLKAMKVWEQENKKWGSGPFQIGILDRSSKEKRINGLNTLNALVKDQLLDILVNPEKISVIDSKLNETMELYKKYLEKDPWIR